MPVSKLLNLPYGSYLMVRLDYMLICGDELEAKIMRIIEMYMDDERKILYRQMLNDPKQNIKPEATIEITKDIWVAISHRLFKNDLYDQEMSENTLKRALKSLIKKKFIHVRDDRAKRYEAPKYQINIDTVQAELDTLNKLGKTEYQKLMVSKIDGIKNASRQRVTPADHQNLTPLSDSRVSNFDPNSRRVTDLVEETEEEDTDASASSSTRTLENASYQPDPELEQQAQEMAASVDRETHKRAIGNLTEQTSEQLSQIEEQRAAIGARENDYHSQLSTVRVDKTASVSAKVAPRQNTAPSSKSVTSKNTNLPPTAQVKEQLTLLGGQVRTDYETIRACRLRLTQANIKALNTLGELDGMTFENLKETIELIEEQELVKKRNIPIDPQSLASEDGYWRFDKWYPVVVRNRAKQASKSSANGQPPLTSASLPSYAHMSDKEYYASLGGVQRR